MKSIEIKELKARINKYINEVKKGDIIYILEKGKPVARLIPEKAGEEANTYFLLKRLADEGRIILPPVHKIPSRPLSRIKVKGSPFSEAIVKDRR